ncbi:glycoside hydrolase family 20 zincin-like fold domain-containing protein [Granulicella tundricola]|uniref:beta-N-acetylhexosaminidase n=1 Tax=Granulicella tundricola (strain ATCC BAA-1859 / DSM 23138 / MP5ACTX9) TaxID=1198114 RepID=E8X6H1_GRATM|nr:glycoside hydrolase family 20 zincin-like fold domain-containing protein [Granulicella tundricola]ADW71055.1 Glycoside hydrolase, family 20, catalytic core [Granulicella tundricola MP5ACTX9]
MKIYKSVKRCSAPRLSGFMRCMVVYCLLRAAVGHTQTLDPKAPTFSPIPREVHAGQRVVVRSATVVVPGGDAEDLFAAHDLEKLFKASGISISPGIGAPTLMVQLLRKDSPQAAGLLKQSGLAFGPEMSAEGYVIVAHTPVVAVIGETSAGVFYGVQTVKQMVESEGGVARIWTGTVSDWPAMRYRGIHDDLSRGPFPTLEFQKHQLEVFAAHKVNLYSPYFEHTLQYAGDPLAAPPGSSLTRAESQDLEEFASRRHIMIVPEQEAFGHLHHVLQYEKYADLAETPHGHVIAPGQAGAQPLIKSWFTQIAEDFPSPFLHIGADETFELGTGRTKSEVDKKGLGPVYAQFLNTIHTTLAPLNRRLLFWGDLVWSDPASVSLLPKDMIAIPWIYWHEDSYDHNLLPFKKAGIETWVAPGDANWRVVYPLGKTALDNISGFVEAGQRLGSTGELTVVWNDDGEGLFNQDWFGVLFGAAAGWQPAKIDGAAYQARFGRVFYGDMTGRIDQAQKELMDAESLVDVADDVFWMDPWSKAGQAKATKMRANIPAARLHAEKAIELIEEARTTDATLREQDALKAMELGARRIDFIGMKFQLADEMKAAYAQAYQQKDDKKRETETRELLYSISSMNGRCQDLRDGYSMIKNLYRDSWLAENRPYWIDNVLVRYDLQIQLWERRGEDINALIDEWQSTKTLPRAEEAGIPPLLESALAKPVDLKR